VTAAPATISSKLESLDHLVIKVGNQQNLVLGNQTDICSARLIGSEQLGLTVLELHPIDATCDEVGDDELLIVQKFDSIDVSKLGQGSSHGGLSQRCKRQGILAGPC